MYGNIYYFHSYLEGEDEEGKVGVVLSCLAKLYFATTVNLEHIPSVKCISINVNYILEKHESCVN